MNCLFDVCWEFCRWQLYASIVLSTALYSIFLALAALEKIPKMRPLVFILTIAGCSFLWMIAEIQKCF